MNINRERLSEYLIDECMPIIEQNHAETGQFDVLNIDWRSYLSIGDSFLCLVMRNEEDEICGILFFMIGIYPHNKDWIMAQQVTFYVLPSYRQYSMRLINFSEKYLDGIVDVILQSARVHTRFCDTLEKKGYEPLDVIFAKRMR